MIREEKLNMIKDAIEEMTSEFLDYGNNGGTQYLRNAADLAAIISTLLADLD